MMKNTINSAKFNFQFFLSNSKIVTSLEEGAKKFGGATKFENEVYSNFEGDENIRITNNNKLSVFIPDTINVNEKTDNEKYIKYAIKYIQENFNNDNVTFYKTIGSWFSDDLQKVVYDNITIISFETELLTEKEIEKMVILAKYIKYEMKQEAVSININSALCLI